MKKNTARILIAVLCLIMAIGIATGSTFAWFSLNNRVTVTGMSVTTKVGDSLQIAADTLGSTAKQADSNFLNGLNQTVTGLLEPVSTINGTSYFYTSSANVAANGDALTDVYAAYDPASTAGINAFDANWGLSSDTPDVADSLGYVDYVFQIKATNTAGSASNVKLTKLNLLYNDTTAAVATINAFRVALFVEDITSAAPAGGVGSLVAIVKPAGGDYLTDGKAVDSTSTLDDVTNLANNGGSPLYANLAAVPANTTKYYKVVVRMWIEGEDEACTNANFLTLTDAWTLDLAIELGTGNGVYEIGSAANLSVGVSGAVATLTIDDTALNSGAVVKTYQWYKVGSPDAAVDGASNASALTAAFTATEDGSYYCIVTAYGSQYRSPTVAIDVP